MSDELRAFYENYDEDGRLSKSNAHKIEFLTTIHYLDKLLPANSRILDICAGCGNYAFYLADKGHTVTACDLMPNHVEAIRANPAANKLVDIAVANALDLSRFDENSFDVVLCMGALYHLFDPADREKCVAECLRVLKPGGIFAFAYINRNSAYLAHLVTDFSFVTDFSIKHYAEILKTGKAGPFYGMEFGEAQQLANKFPLSKIAEIGVNGLMYPLSNMLNSLNPEDFTSYMEYHLATCEEPSIIGHSAHGLWIGTYNP